MHLFARWGLLSASLVTAGCGADKSVEVAPARDSNAIRRSAPRPQDEPAGEQVLDGTRVDPFANSDAKAVVLIFVSTDCPIANRYAPELSRLYEAYQSKSVSFWLVYADTSETPEMIRRHIAEYRHQIPALRDPNHQLVRICQATRTPEAAVFAPGPTCQYLGRIDDRFTDYGKSRERASQHDLQEAIEAVLAGTAVPTPRTTAIGCPIPGVEQ